MAKFNVLDVISIQDCLSGYERLINMIEPEDDVDLLLKDERLRIIKHLQCKCEIVLKTEKRNG